MGDIDRGFQKQMKQMEQDFQERMKKIDARLATQKSEKDALREYRFDARKHLYNEFEPLLFQFSESCDSAMMCIFNLARNAREGRLGPNIRWLSPAPKKEDSASHYLWETTYYLLSFSKIN